MLHSRFVILVFLFLGSCTSIFGQNQKIDSLLKELNLATTDTLRVNVLTKLSNEFIGIDSKKIGSYALEALELSNKINFQKGKADSYYYLGVFDNSENRFDDALNKLKIAEGIYEEVGSKKDIIYLYIEIGYSFEFLNIEDSAIFYYDGALKISSEIKDELLIAHSNYYLSGLYQVQSKNKKALSYALEAHTYYESRNLLEDDWYVLNVLGIIHSDMGLYAEALEYNLQALEISLELGDKNSEIIIGNNLAVLYNTIQNNDLAIKYYEEAYETTKIIGDVDMEATLLGNLAGLKAEMGDTTTALIYTRKALSLQLENNFTCELAYSYEGFGDIFIGQNILDSALFYLKKALEIGLECKDIGIEVSVLRNLGIAYRKQGNFNHSEKHLLKSLELAKNAVFKNEEREASLELYRLFKKTKNQAKALEYHEYYQKLGDSIFNQANSERVNKLTSEYEFRKEKKLLELENEKLLLEREAELENQTLIRNAALMMLFFAIIFLIVIFQSNLYIKLQNSRLKVLNNEKNTLMGIVAHDLRNPLNNIKTIIPIMKDKSPEAQESMPEFVDMISDTTERMYSMIDRILDVDAVEEMRVKLKMKVTDLGEITNNICKSFQIPAEQKGIKIDCQVHLKEFYVKLDKNYLIQILENLVSNAIKFSESNTSIQLSIIKNKDQVEIKIKDEGPGISEKDQDMLFSRYGRLSNKPTAGESSTGLGLSIVKKYVEAMGGKISCQSALGKGSTFILIFKSTDNGIV